LPPKLAAAAAKIVPRTLNDHNSKAFSEFEQACHKVKGGRCDDRDDVLWCAVLIESERRNGSPRQQTVAYLGSIRQRFMEATAHRQNSSGHADAKLDDLELDRATRKKVVAVLLVIVPRPTKADLKQLEKDRRVLHASLKLLRR
jgi:hypothetical protein